MSKTSVIIILLAIMSHFNASATPFQKMDAETALAQLEITINESEVIYGRDFAGAPEELVKSLRFQLERIYYADIAIPKKTAVAQLFQRLNKYSDYTR